MTEIELPLMGTDVDCACGRVHRILTRAIQVEEGVMDRIPALMEWRIPVAGTQGFEQAQVTAGGVHMDGFDWDTLASRRVPGLYAAGEVLDVDGDCGGFNLQWAWSSALIAARDILRNL